MALQLIFAVALTVAMLLFVQMYAGMKYPRPRALGQILPKLCVVAADEILAYNELLEQERSLNPHSRRTLRRNQIRINRSYLSQMGWNTLLFQKVLRFEAMKIDPSKSSFDYESRETLVLDLADESAQLRWEVRKARVDLIRRALLRQAVNQELLKSLLGNYKLLEQDFIALIDMAEDTCYRDMLIERLGLTNWSITGSDSVSPEPA